MATEDALSAVMLEAGLTDSEARVMALAAAGYSYPEIARRLGYALHSVECYASRGRLKLIRQQHRLETVAWQQAEERVPAERLRFRRGLLERALREAQA